MIAKSHGSFRKNFIKFSIVILSVFILALGASYIWFIHNSKQLLIDLVKERSHGKLQLQLAEATFNFNNNEVKIREAKLTSTNKNEAPISYNVSFRRITLHTNSVWSLLFNQSLEIRDIKVFDPTVEVYNNFEENPGPTNQLSIGSELGKIYNSIQEGISALHTHSISVTNAKLILHNKETPDKKPIVFSNIYFTLKKLNKFNNEPGQYLQHNNLEFSSSNQDILLSDGMHKLSFKKLSIKEARSIILDTCTIIALPTHTSGSNYSISFKKLALIGVDFEALYKKNIIRADSVYCENPNSIINLNSSLTDSALATRGMPDLERIIRNLSGNLDFGFIGVTNADIHLDITGKTALSNFHSGKVNFEINNLRINPDSSKPVSIQNFDMMVKGYRLYNSDSTSVFSFDSVRFSNDKLLLNNFTVHTISGKYKIRNYRDYSMPFFELLGINWSELIFRQNLKATAAILHDPIINYRKNKEVEISKKSILFNSHHSLDDFMDIEKLKIINGTVNIDWGINNSLQLDGLDLNLLGNNITDYKHVSLSHDVESLFFREGLLKIGDIDAQLRNVIFNARDQVLADELLIKNTRGGFDAKISNVSINKITSEKNNGSFIVDGLKWDNGIIKVNAKAGNKIKHKPSSILLQNVAGKKTGFQIISGETIAGAFIDDIQIAYFLKKNDRPFVMNGLSLTGNAMNLSNNSTKITAQKFILSDDVQEFNGANFEQSDPNRNVTFIIPAIKLTGDFNDYFYKDLRFKNIVLQSPEINYDKENTRPVFQKKSFTTAAITIDQINIHQPVLNVHLRDSASSTGFLLPYSRAGEIKIEGVTIDSDKITATNINLTSGKAEVNRANEKVLKVDSSISLNLQKINLSSRNNQSAPGALLTKLSLQNSDGFTFHLKENTIRLQDISAGNILLTDSLMNNPIQLLALNPGAWISTSAVNYFTKNSLWYAENVNYNGNVKELSVDSMNYHPQLSRDSAIASSRYQMDYIFFNCGKAFFQDFDAVQLLRDNSLALQKINLTHPSINIYRDKFPPFQKGIRKKLFTEEIKDMDLPTSVNEVSVHDGEVSYTERNAKSRLNGNFTLTHLNGNISNVTNHRLQHPDSLMIKMTGRLLDKSSFALDLHQSYNDSLYGFMMNLQLDPTPLSILNPLLAPLSDVKFLSGNLDDFKMHVSGNENFAYGKMKFYYHHLHIKLLKKGGTEKTRLLKSTESNLVNFFFLKNNNTSRTGLIYFERIKDRSFFNYMTKIIFSGISTSVGARRNSNYQKQYKKNDIKF